MLFFFLSALETDEERGALTSLYEQYKDLLVRVAMKYLRQPDLAEDAVHETFFEAIRHKNEILTKTPLDFRRWSVVVTENKCRDILRRRKIIDQSLPFDDDDNIEFVSDYESFDISTIRQEDYEKLAECLKTLDPINRQIIEMKYLIGMPYSEIAMRMKMTETQVQGRLQRTRTRVKNLLMNRGDKQ